MTEMAKNIEMIAKRLGAEVVCQVPDVGGGVFGMTRLAGIIQQLRLRLEPSKGQRPGRPTDPQWVHHPKVPLTRLTQEALEKLAAVASTPERKVSPMQVAAQLLEQAVAQASAEMQRNQ
jgi:hypothetical protein